MSKRKKFDAERDIDHLQIRAETTAEMLHALLRNDWGKQLDGGDWTMANAAVFLVEDLKTIRKLRKEQCKRARKAKAA